MVEKFKGKFHLRYNSWNHWNHVYNNFKSHKNTKWDKWDKNLFLIQTFYKK